MLTLIRAEVIMQDRAGNVRRGYRMMQIEAEKDCSGYIKQFANGVRITITFNQW